MVVLFTHRGPVHMVLSIHSWYCLHVTVHSPSVLCPVRSPCRMTPRLLPSMLGSRPLSRRTRTSRRRPPLPVAASRLPTSSSRWRSPRSSLWSIRLHLTVSACHLYRRLLWSRPRSSSPPPLLGFPLGAVTPWVSQPLYIVPSMTQYNYPIPR
jgi:hypothetical protein